jgi:hypothetical protein
MKKNQKKTRWILIISLLFLGAMLALFLKKPHAYVGRYENGPFHITLKANGRFVAENYIILEGQYKVMEESVVFHIQTLNENPFQNVREGRLDASYLYGPDGIKYERVVGLHE